MLEIPTSVWIALCSGAALALGTIVAVELSRSNRVPVKGRTVLLTGASEGLGLSAARQLAAKGANVILVARNVQRLQEALAQVEAAAMSPSQRFHYISADVAEHNYAEAVIAEAKAWNNGQVPEIVWCVAGMSTPLLWVEHEGAIEAARRNMDVNYFGAAEMSRAVLREWLSPAAATSPREQPKHLVFTASTVAFFPLVGYAPYTPSKFALRALADTLAMELLLYPENPVQVHLVCPATITTPGFEREKETKPDITAELEKDEPPQTPDTVARKSIEGLEKGQHFITTSFLTELMRCGMMGNSPRNNWFLDTVVGWFMPLIYFFVMEDMNGKVTGWARKHGHPSTYKKQ